MLLAETLREATRVQVWKGGDHGSLVAACAWLEDAVRLVRAMDLADADNLVITEGTRQLWDTGCSVCSDGPLHLFDSDQDALDAIWEENDIGRTATHSLYNAGLPSHSSSSGHKPGVRTTMSPVSGVG